MLFFLKVSSFFLSLEKKTLPHLNIKKIGAQQSDKSVAVSVVSNLAEGNNPEFRLDPKAESFEEKYKIINPDKILG